MPKPIIKTDGTQNLLTNYYHSCAISNYKAHPVGVPSAIPEKQRDMIKRHGKFILLGTSGLTNLVIACACTKDIEYNVRVNLTPKLFIVDNSIYVQQFWFVMKEIVEKCNTLADLKTRLNESIDKLKECCNPNFFNNHDTIINFIQKIIDDNKTDHEDEEFLFTYIKNIILQTTVICDDMQNPVVFSYINQMNNENLPVFAYASNIIEFISTEQYNFLSNVYKENFIDKSIEKVKLILSNINSLNPEYVLHLRTTKKQSNKLCLAHGKEPDKNVELNPDLLIVVPKEHSEVNKSLELLCNDKYTPIMIASIDTHNVNTMQQPSAHAAHA
jgi:hypothetical protein